MDCVAFLEKRLREEGKGAEEELKLHKKTCNT